MKKGQKTEEFILKKSIKIFAEKGYTAVTMKDICEATDLSRGGLYRHYSSTKEIFTAILDKDIEDNGSIVDEVIQQKVPAKVIFAHFLAGEKEAALGNNKGWFFAVHEFAFMENDRRSYLDERVFHAGQILKKILRYGHEKGEFKKFDIETLSFHILTVLDGIKTSSSVLSISEETIDRQIDFIEELIYIN